MPREGALSNVALLRLRLFLALARRRVPAAEVAADGGEMCGELSLPRVGRESRGDLNASIASFTTSAQRASIVYFTCP